MQSPASGFEVACKYVERLSVGNLSNLRDELKLLIVKCMEIEVNVETVMQIVDKAFRMGILDNDSLNDMKEIVSAILKAKEKEIESNSGMKCYPPDRCGCKESSSMIESH